MKKSSRTSTSSLLFSAAAAAFVAAPSPAATATTTAAALPVLHAAPARTSVSGLSSGGFMAVQYAVAFSSTVAGVGVIAGGPYNCAWVNPGGTDTCTVGRPSASASWRAAQGFAAIGGIDPVAGLAKMKAYVFSGTLDTEVKPPVVEATRDFFVAAGMPAAWLAFVDTVPAGHAFIAPSFGHSCSASEPPYVGRCTVDGRPYDQPQAILEHIHGSLRPAASVPSATPLPFDQREFGGASTGLDDTGFVYVPAACRNAAAGICAVHVVFHGCRQGAGAVGDSVYASAGYNRWADTNRLIVLYPQVKPTNAFPYNPRGCWDWWGYTGLDFQLKRGAQLSAVKAMVDRLTTP